ncbi:MAG: hypothetical protein QOK14_1863, partial [Frankiaceae bacterium]|nr:hypothetical protein [Frankiaceae bacterium]
AVGRWRAQPAPSAALTAPLPRQSSVDLRDARSGWIPVLTDNRPNALQERVIAASEKRDVDLRARSEHLVTARLRLLESAGWRTVHAIPIGTAGCNVDHLVIGPGGVFALSVFRERATNVWAKGSTIIVDGGRQDWIHDASFVAGRAARMLSTRCEFAVRVQPVVVVVDALRLTVEGDNGGVQVTNRTRLLSWIESHERRLSEDEIDVIEDTARHPETWGMQPLPVSAGAKRR